MYVKSIACIFCSGDSRYAEKWYQSCIRDGWRPPVTVERAEHTNESVARKLNISQQNCRVSERIVSAAEQLYMLASAQTISYSKQNGSVHCRSSSRDSGLGKDSDSGSSSSGIHVPRPGSRMPAHSFPYTTDPESPRHHCSQTSSQPPNQPVCTVLPMRTSGRNASRTAACEYVAPRYPAPETAQLEAFQDLNRCDGFSGTSPQLDQQHRHQPEFSDFRCRNGSQQGGHRFPVAEHVPYLGNMVNPLHYGGSHMPSAHQLSRYRGNASGQAARYTAASMYACSRGRGMERVPPAGDITDSVAFVPNRHLTGTSVRMSTFDYASGQLAYGQRTPAERQDELLYREHHNVNGSCQSAVDLYHDSADVARYRAVQQRYQPYDISADSRRGNSTVPPGRSRNLFYETSPRGLMQFRQNNALFYDSHTSGIR